jgi:hypothetical protein
MHLCAKYHFYALNIEYTDNLHSHVDSSEICSFLAIIGPSPTTLEKHSKCRKWRTEYASPQCHIWLRYFHCLRDGIVLAAYNIVARFYSDIS